MQSKLLLLMFLLKNIITIQCRDPNEIVYVLRGAPREYSIETEYCCDGAIDDKSVIDYECCGHNFMNRKTDFCCAGKVYDVNANTNIHCCDNVTYNVTEFDCRASSNLIIPYFTFTGKGRIVVPRPTSQHYCGTTPMRQYEKVCCNSVANDNPDQNLNFCCGTHGYNTDTHVCCESRGNEDDTVILKSDPGDNECCNFVSYNITTHYCSHDNKILQRPTDKVVCNGYIMDPKTHVCCRDAVLKDEPHHDSCCGDKTISSAEGKCCCNPNSESQCKFHEYPPGVTYAECCVTELRLSHMRCCDGAGTNNPQNQTCCKDYGVGSEIYDGADKICCGTKSYVKESQACCGITVVPKPKDGNTNCCKYAVNFSDSTPTEVVAVGFFMGDLETYLIKQNVTSIV